MTCYKSRVVRAALAKKGFRPVNSRDIFYIYYHNEQKTGVRTMLSMGSNHDIGDNLISKMARQLHLDKNEFQKLIDCTLSRDGLCELYEKRGILQATPKLEL